MGKFFKIAAFYHGNNIKNIKKFLKHGIPKNTFIARRKKVAKIHAGKQSALYDKKSAIIEINIPKSKRYKYFKSSADKKTIMDITGGKLHKSMQRNRQVKQTIPPKYIKITSKPSKKKLKKIFLKEQAAINSFIYPKHRAEAANS